MIKTDLFLLSQWTQGCANSTLVLTASGLDFLHGDNNPLQNHPDSKVHGANMGPIWGWQDPGGPHVGPMNFALWAVLLIPLYDAAWKTGTEADKQS